MTFSFIFPPFFTFRSGICSFVRQCRVFNHKHDVPVLNAFLWMGGGGLLASMKRASQEDAPWKQRSDVRVVNYFLSLSSFIG